MSINCAERAHEVSSTARLAWTINTLFEAVAKVAVVGRRHVCLFLFALIVNALSTTNIAAHNQIFVSHVSNTGRRRVSRTL